MCFLFFFSFLALFLISPPQYFDFRNLTGISINLKSGFYNHNIDMLLEGVCASPYANLNSNSSSRLSNLQEIQRLAHC